MKIKLLLKSIEDLPGEDLDAHFAEVFDLEQRSWASGEDLGALLKMIYDHGIKMEVNEADLMGVISVTLTPRKTRNTFKTLRGIYYQGLGVEAAAEDKYQGWRIRTISRTGIELPMTLMKALLELAFRDAFYGVE